MKIALAEAYPRPFHSEVLAAAGERGVPPGLMYAVMKKESNFIPDSVSWAGAVGLMQIMPATARHLKASYNNELPTRRGSKTRRPTCISARRICACCSTSWGRTTCAA